MESQERMKGELSKLRDRSLDESLSVWAEMKAGSSLGQQNCLRFKIDATVSVSADY